MTVSFRCLSILVISVCLFQGCGSSEEAPQPESENVSTGTMKDFQQEYPDTPGWKVVSAKDVKIDPAERDKWAEKVRNTLEAGNKEGAKDYLARIRNHFGAQSAYEAFGDAGIYEADEALRRWAVGMIDGLMVEQEEDAVLVVADALLRFARDPVQSIRDSALGEIRSLARDHVEVVAYVRPALLEMLQQEADDRAKRSTLNIIRDLARVDGLKFTDFSRVEHPLATNEVVDALTETMKQPKLLEPSAEALGTICGHNLQLANALLDRFSPQLEGDSEEETLVAIKLISMIVNAVEQTRSHHMLQANPPAEATVQLTAFREKLPGIKSEFEEIREGDERKLRTEVLFPINSIDATLSRPLSR